MLISQAIANNQGQTVTDPPTQPPLTLFPQTTTTIVTTTTESLKIRKEKNRYCNIPIFVSLLIPCVRIQNFVNCPNFNNKSEECEESKELIRTCGNEMRLQYS